MARPVPEQAAPGLSNTVIAQARDGCHPSQVAHRGDNTRFLAGIGRTDHDYMNIIGINPYLQSREALVSLSQYVCLERVDVYNSKGWLLEPKDQIHDVCYMKCYCSKSEIKSLLVQLFSIRFFNCVSINKLMHMIHGNITLIFLAFLIYSFIHFVLYVRTFYDHKDLLIFLVLVPIHVYDLYVPAFTAVSALLSYLKDHPYVTYGCVVCQIIGFVFYAVLYATMAEMDPAQLEALLRDPEEHNREMHAANGNICVFVYTKGRRTYITLHIEWLLNFHDLMKMQKWVSFFIDKTTNSSLPSHSLRSIRCNDICWIIDPFFIDFLVSVGTTPMYTIVFFSQELVIHLDTENYKRLISNNPQPLPDDQVDHVVSICKMVAFSRAFRSWVNPLLSNKLMHALNGNFMKFTLAELEKAFDNPKFDSFNYVFGECKLSRKKFTDLAKKYDFKYVHRKTMGNYALNDYRFVITKKNDDIIIHFTELDRESYYNWKVNGIKPPEKPALSDSVEEKSQEHKPEKKIEKVVKPTEEFDSIEESSDTEPEVQEPKKIPEKEKPEIVLDSGYDVDGLELPLLADLRDGEKPSLIPSEYIENLFLPYTKERSSTDGFFYDKVKILSGSFCFIMSLSLRSFTIMSHPVHIWLRVFLFVSGAVLCYLGKISAVAGDVSWFSLHKQSLIDSKIGFSKDDNAKKSKIYRYRVRSRLRLKTNEYKVTEAYWAVSHDLISEIMSQASILTNLDSINAFVDTRIASLSSRLKNLNLDLRNVNCGVLQSTKLICTALLSKTMMEAKGQGFV